MKNLEIIRRARSDRPRGMRHANLLRVAKGGACPPLLNRYNYCSGGILILAVGFMILFLPGALFGEGISQRSGFVFMEWAAKWKWTFITGPLLNDSLRIMVDESIPNRREVCKQFLNCLVLMDSSVGYYYLGCVEMGFYDRIQDLKSAEKYFLKAANLGNPDAQYFLGEYYLKGINFPRNSEKGIFWFKKAAESGNFHAQAEIGYKYYFGEYLKKDINEGLRLSKLAAERGSLAAFNLIFLHYSSGNSKEYGLELKKWEGKLRSLAESGNIDLQEFLGRILFEGGRVERNVAEGLKWLQLAAENSNRNAQHFLGMIYDNGWECEKDLEKAAYWYGKGSARRHTLAMGAFAEMLERGEGTARNLIESYKLYKMIADDLFETPAIVREAKRKMKILSQKMTPVERAKIRQENIPLKK